MAFPKISLLGAQDLFEPHGVTIERLGRQGGYYKAHINGLCYEGETVQEVLAALLDSHFSVKPVPSWVNAYASSTEVPHD